MRDEHLLTITDIINKDETGPMMNTIMEQVQKLRPNTTLDMLEFVHHDGNTYICTLK